jgi:mannonate dehydratase
MRESWRWFGPDDPVPLAHVRQAGAREVVTALHHIPPGEPWPAEEIARRRDEIRATGLEWTVCESLPVSEAIKTRSGPWRRHLENWAASARNLAAAGVSVICYNVMPVIDWTRTELDHSLPDGALALRFDTDAFAAFDLFILRRKGAEADWPKDRIARAEVLFGAMDQAARDRLTRTVIAGLPGAAEGWTLESFRAALETWRGVGSDDLRAALGDFLAAVLPAVSEAGLALAIHPDDPPRPLLGLPRITSTESDLAAILALSDAPCHGLTLCTGSLGARAENDVVGMARRFGPRIHFAHLRNVRRESDAESFHEAAHLDGDVDMAGVVLALRDEERRRGAQIPMRPDHGHRILDDQHRQVRPGYSAIGRLKGLAELRGLTLGLDR